MSPKALKEKQEEWLRWNERLNHILHPKMRRLDENTTLPKYLNETHALPLCPSYDFSDSKQKPSITKSATVR